MNYNELNARINGQNFILVNFYATWCGPCRVMHPILDELQSQCGDNMEIIHLDVDMSENVMLSKRYRVMSVPTLILFYRGRQLWRNSGLLSLETLSDVIRRVERVGAY